MALKKESTNTCIKRVDEHNCPYCHTTTVVKNGKTKTGTQRYLCNHCNKSFRREYKNKAFTHNINVHIITFIREGLGISSIARILSISTTTVLKRIQRIATEIKKPRIPMGKSYEVDEIRTYVGKKDRLYWIVYALERASKKVMDFAVGSRTNQTLGKVTTNLIQSNAIKIYTDKLRNYKTLIAEKLHSTYLHGTNHIERNNLTIRTHIKRLNRKTICFSRSPNILQSVLKIYFWS